jgi:type IV pilus assembly protein PilA
MISRIRAAMEKRDEGFTLIELLVVIIIIGILAAIAIPVFLSQRDKGYQSAIKSDLRNAATAEESYATDNNGDYTATTTELDSQGLRHSDGVTVAAALYTVNGNAKGAYCLTGTSSHTDKKFYRDSQNGTITDSKPDNC